MTTWTASGSATGGSFSIAHEDDFVLYADRPIPQSVTSRVQLDTVSSSGTTTLTSPVLIKRMRDLSNTQRIHVGTHIYVPSKKTTAIVVKYKYNNGSWQTLSKTITLPAINEPTWIYASSSFDISGIALGDFQQQIAFDIVFDSGGANGIGGDYTYHFNGITIGSDAENVASKCIGQPSTYSISSLNGGKASATIFEYGSNLTAVIDGVPLHYGLEHATKLIPWIPDYPSFTINGSGFMGSSNAKKTATLEFWMRVGKASVSPVRLVGPVNNSDGIYLNNTTLVLSIANIEVGYDIGTIDHPMLIHWVNSPENSYVMMNGEVVLEVPARPNTSYYSESNQIGFYTDRQIDPVHIASIATYSYPVPPTIAKIRFVRGQGTLAYDLIASKYDSVSYSADFSTSNFASNLSYPDNMTWSSGTYNNLVTRDTISLPQYSIPDIIGTASISEWMEANKGLFSKPTEYGTKLDTTPLDYLNDNTSGTQFTNTPKVGRVFTTQSSASKTTNEVAVPTDLPLNAKFRVYGEAKFAGSTPYGLVTIGGHTTTENFTLMPGETNKYYIDMLIDIPVGTTTITWGLGVGAGITFGQFDNVYCKFEYGDQPIILNADSTEAILTWGDLNFLDGAPVKAISVDTMFPDVSVNNTILSIKKRGTSLALYIYINNGVVYYEYEDYTGSEVISSFIVDDNDNFTVGVAIDELVENFPETAHLFSQTSDIEVVVGSTGFSGYIYSVSFHNPFDKERLKNILFSATNGILDENIRSFIDVVVSTYTLRAVTAYGNFTLDVASTGYWQETVPLSFFVKEVNDRYGNKVNKIDFIQVNVGKSHQRMGAGDQVQMTYSQLLNNYWGKAYSSLESDYADYNALAAETYTSYDPESLDIQTWIALQRISDEIVDYTKKEAAVTYDDSVIYLDDDGRRYLVQDGNSIIIPYTYDYNKYTLVTYHVFTSSGVRSSPVKLKSYELASWASDMDKWTPMFSKEGNKIYPYVSNGSYFVYEYPNVFEVTKRGFNYLYKSNRSGYKPRTKDFPGYNSGLLVQWTRGVGENDASSNLLGYSMMVHMEKVPDQESLITRVLIGSQVEFDVYAIPVGDSKYTIVAKDRYGVEYAGLQWRINGSLVNNPTLNALQWYLLQCSLAIPLTPNGNVVNVMLVGDSTSFDNVSLQGVMDATMRGTTINRRWQDLVGEDWDYWNAETWRSLYDLGTVVSISANQDEMVYELTGIKPEVMFSSSCSPQFQEVFVIRDIEWATMDVKTK